MTWYKSYYDNYLRSALAVLLKCWYHDCVDALYFEQLFSRSYLLVQPSQSEPLWFVCISITNCDFIFKCISGDVNIMCYNLRLTLIVDKSFVSSMLLRNYKQFNVIMITIMNYFPSRFVDGTLSFILSKRHYD